MMSGPEAAYRAVRVAFFLELRTRAPLRPTTMIAGSAAGASRIPTTTGTCAAECEASMVGGSAVSTKPDANGA